MDIETAPVAEVSAKYPKGEDHYILFFCSVSKDHCIEVLPDYWGKTGRAEVPLLRKKGLNVYFFTGRILMGTVRLWLEMGFDPHGTPYLSQAVFDVSTAAPSECFFYQARFKNRLGYNDIYGLWETSVGGARCLNDPKDNSTFDISIQEAAFKMNK